MENKYLKALDRIRRNLLFPVNWTDEDKEHYSTIVEALEKQVPKKARYVDIRFRNHGRRISDGCSLSKCYKCPNCGSHIFHVFDDENYCEHCGQAIDWEEGGEE